MFDFDAGKLVVVGVVALIVIGPKELPRVLRQVGQTVSKLRRMAADFQSQFMDAMREAEMADVKEEMGKIADSAKINVAFDPMRDMRNQIGGVMAGDARVGDAAIGDASTVADLSTNSVDLTALEQTSSPMIGDAIGAGGLVAAGTAPQPAETSEHSDGGGSTGSDALTSQATLDDVRQALDETLEGSKHPVKEHTS